MAQREILIVGNYLSPFVRKVLVCLELKNLSYVIDPIVPFFGSDEFSSISPLRRIPVLIDERVTLTDSTVICQYLDERYPQVPVLPASPEDRARARWLEEYADTHIADVVIWRLFNQLVIRPYVWGKETDQQVVAKAITQELPALLDFLEPQLPVEGWLFDQIGVADITLAALFRNAAFAGYSPDAAKWPRCSAFLTRVLNHPAFIALQPFEDLSIRTPIARQRDELIKAGAPISDTTLGTATPREGIMKT